jgi:hypothetical protein
MAYSHPQDVRLEVFLKGEVGYGRETLVVFWGIE